MRASVNERNTSMMGKTPWKWEASNSAFMSFVMKWLKFMITSVDLRSRARLACNSSGLSDSGLVSFPTGSSPPRA